MKIAVVLVACLGLALGASVPAPAAVKADSTLLDDLMEFMELLPLDEVQEITMYYMENDEEVQGFLVWTQSEDFKALVLMLTEIPAYIDFLDYLYFHGIDAYAYVNAIHEGLGLDPLVPPSRPVLKVFRGSGYRGLIDEIRALIPTEEVKALWRYKVANSPDFKDFVDMLESDEFITIVRAVQAAPQYQEAVKQLEAKGIDMQLFILYLRELFGWGG